MLFDVENILSDLHEDHRAAAYELFVRLFNELSGKTSLSNYMEANGILTAYFKVRNLSIPRPLYQPGRNEVDANDAIEYADLVPKFQFEAFKHSTLKYQQEYVAEIARSKIDSDIDIAVGYAVLSPEEKEKCRIHFDAIKSIIDESDLDDGKKNLIFLQVSKVLLEIDRNGTRTDAVFAFAGEAAFVMGDMARKSKPFIIELKDILKIVTKARARKEGVQLPPSEEILSLPTPDVENGEEHAN